MKLILKKVAALLCASAIITLSYPEIGNGISLAEMLKTNNSANAKPAEYSNVAEKKFTEPAAADSDPAAKNFTATAYALRGRTRSGLGVKRGVIAADERILPLGTKVRITAGAWSGNYLVADTGGLIKGHIIDVWVPNKTEARKFGRRKVKLSVVGK